MVHIDYKNWSDLAILPLYLNGGTVFSLQIEPKGPFQFSNLLQSLNNQLCQDSSVSSFKYGTYRYIAIIFKSLKGLELVFSLQYRAKRTFSI